MCDIAHSEASTQMLSECSDDGNICEGDEYLGNDMVPFPDNCGYDYNGSLSDEEDDAPLSEVFESLMKKRASIMNPYVSPSVADDEEFDVTESAETIDYLEDDDQNDMCGEDMVDFEDPHLLSPCGDKTEDNDIVLHDPQQILHVQNMREGRENDCGTFYAAAQCADNVLMNSNSAGLLKKVTHAKNFIDYPRNIWLEAGLKKKRPRKISKSTHRGAYNGIRDIGNSRSNRGWLDYGSHRGASMMPWNKNKRWGHHSRRPCTNRLFLKNKEHRAFNTYPCYSKNYKRQRKESRQNMKTMSGSRCRLRKGQTASSRCSGIYNSPYSYNKQSGFKRKYTTVRSNGRKVILRPATL